MSKRLNGALKVILALAFAISMLACVVLHNPVSANASKVIIKDSGSIRYEAPAGIRFSAYVSNELFADVATHTLNDGVTVGMYLVPSSYNTSNATEIDGTTAGVKTVSSADAGFKWSLNNEKDGYQQFDVVIHNIPEASYGETILAAAFANDEVSATISRSIANVAASVLAENELLDTADKLDETQVSALNGYVSAENALGNVAVKIVDGVAKWDAVDGAVAYLVKTSNGIVKTSGTSASLNGATSVSVIAYGDGTANTYSAVATKTAHALAADQLASFDDESYVEELYVSNPKFIDNSYWTVSRTFVKVANAVGVPSPILRKNRADSTGALANGIEIGVPITAYQQAGARYAAFSIQLQKGLDLTNNAGIRVRMNITGSYIGETDASQFKYYLCGQDSLNQGYKSGAATNVAYNTLSALNTIFDWYITSEELATYYKNGDSFITFMMYYAGARGTGSGGHGIAVLLDDISYYSKLDTPKNLAISNNVLTWDAVANAENYVINVNGTDVATVATNSYDLSAYAATGCTVKVKATSTTIDASEYSEECSLVVVAGLDIAAFNSADYESTVKFLLDNKIQPWNDGTIDYSKVSPKAEYQTNVDGAEGGDALSIQPVIAHYGSGGGARHAVFTVQLAKGLDLSGETYDSIVIRFKPVDITPGLANGGTDSDTIDIIQLCNPTTKDKTYTSYNSGTNGYEFPSMAVTEGQWIEWTLTVDELKTLYADGATELVFAMVTKAGASHSFANPAHTYLDYIRYVED